ncbi:Gfo/Idh/MocA family protein [Leadbetterella byssophila]|uniref:Gfo/Idh/MocA family protein n=1 Tax=Leadbetterella byssophila TaxID=316068 RepID=UPI0039A2AB1B
MNRSEFIKTLAAGALISRPFLVHAHKTTYTLALIGSGWWGTNILREALKHGGCRLVALCDVDRNQVQKCYEEVRKISSFNPKIYTDYEELLQKEKPDIVINATPDHWHALIAIAALKSGSHLYLEKPIGHTIAEGQAICKAVVDSGKVCTVGFHRRFSPHNVSGMNFLKSGKVGVIKEVRAFVHYNYWPGNPSPEQAIPEGLDWDKWCGPAPLVPYKKSIHPRGWRQRMEFANGQLGDWGPHWFDQILWWTEEIGPKSIHSLASKKIKNDDQNSPESQVVLYEFEEFNCIWEHSNLNGRGQSKTENVGVYFHGTEGTFHMGWMNGWTFYPKDSKSTVIHEDAQLNQPDSQNIDLVWNDFMQSIENKKTPFADIIKGHRATNMSLLGVAALNAGKTLHWDPVKETLGSTDDKLLRRDYRKGYTFPK